MKTSFQKLLNLLFIITFSLCEFSYGYFTTKGQNFINRKTGEVVVLRGFGIGGWLLPEGYMWGIRKIDRPWQFEKAIEDLIGKEDAKKFWKLYYENYFTEGDVAAMKSWGVNSIRIPILAAVLQPREVQPNFPPYSYSEYGFKLLDNVVNWCKKYEIGIIWDLHGAPGGQNAENISDSDGEARLWTEKEKYWPRCIDLWFKIAERYKNEECIIGYDLLNEPLLLRYKNVDPTLLRELYIKLTDTIRTVDKDGIIFIEGDDWAQNFDILEPLDWDPHLVIAFHSYPPTSNQEALNRWDKLRKKYNIPLWHGETGEQGPPYALNIEATKFLESVNVSWSWWTHKKFDLKSQPWSIIRLPGFLKILDYWNGFNEKPSKKDAKKWLFKQAELTHSDYCEFYPDMVRSLFPLNPDNYLNSKTISKPKIVFQPENIIVEEGNIAQTLVIAKGFPLNYRWYKNGKLLEEQKSCRLIITNPSLSDNNSSYYAEIYNSSGTIKSKKVSLIVKPFSGTKINYTSTAPNIDTKADDIWNNIAQLKLNKVIYGKIDSEEDFSGYCKLLWDNVNLYILIEVKDDIVSENSKNSNQQDAIEIYLDPYNKKSQSYEDNQCHLRLLRTSSSVETLRGKLIGDIALAKKDFGNGYIIELAIPWESLNFTPASEKIVGIDIHIIDGDNDSASRIALYGRQGREAPIDFGTVKLVRK